MIELSYERAVDLLREAVEESGKDYVYPAWGEDRRCDYVRYDAPSCLVGHVLFKAGVSIDRLSKADLGAGTGAQDLMIELEKEGVLETTPTVWGMLDRAQCYQDSGEPWGEVLESVVRR